MTGPMRSVVGAGSCDSVDARHCAVCADEAVVAVVLSVDLHERTAEISEGSTTRTVALDLVGGITPGSRVLVHFGFVIACRENT